MNGIVRSLREKSGYGFIRANGIDYFFHREDFLNNWFDMVSDFNNDVKVEVEFEPKETPKGPRASDVRIKI